MPPESVVRVQRGCRDGAVGDGGTRRTRYQAGLSAYVSLPALWVSVLAYRTYRLSDGEPSFLLFLEIYDAMKFRTILADPPWDYHTWSEKSEAMAERHYTCMDILDICKIPVPAVTAKDCVLMMWTTWTHLELSMAVLKSWGFEYKTGFPWLKLSKDMLPRMGTGYHARACTEPLLIGTRGNPRAPEPHERREGVLFSKIGKHSAKPDTIYEYAELYDGPFLEMFARPDGGLDQPRPNWTRAGNEIDGLDIADALCRLAALPQPALWTPDIDTEPEPPAQETLAL